MTWQVETIYDAIDDTTIGYTVTSHIGGDAELPIDLMFYHRLDAEKLAKWLNKKDDWIDRLETIIEHELDLDLNKLKNEFGKEQGENREKEIKQIIDEEIHELTQGVIGTISMLNMPTKELDARNNIIKRLKEGGYLK